MRVEQCWCARARSQEGAQRREAADTVGLWAGRHSAAAQGSETEKEGFEPSKEEMSPLTP